MAKTEFPRAGAWARLADGTIGIINSIQGDTAEFHATNDNGETTSVVGMYVQDKEMGRKLDGGIPLRMLKQAALSDIPKKRRPPKEHGTNLGYK